MDSWRVCGPRTRRRPSRGDSGRTRTPGGPRLIAVCVLACALAGCGGSASSPTTAARLQPSSADVRSYPIDPVAFGPLYGSGCPDNGACGCGNATSLAEEFSCQLANLAAYDIPITAYLFDGGAWSAGHSTPDQECTGPECCSWKLGTQPVSLMARNGVRALLHEWGGCSSTEQYQRAYDSLGQNLLGFYLDDGSSDAELRQVTEFMQGVRPNDWACVAKAYQNQGPSTTDAGLSNWASAAYVGDLANDFSGLQEAVTRILTKAGDLPTPFAELTGYAYRQQTIPSEEVYHRRLQFGALQPVMAHTPYANCDPWRPEYSPGLLQSYRYYAWLHKELVPYFYSYSYGMFESSDQPLLRQGPMPYSFLVGDELFVPVITEATNAIDVQLPAGQWIDYWDDSLVLSGTVQGFPAPLGKEPFFMRQGSLIPLDVQRDLTGHGTRESSGALTVLVYPSGTSAFRYRDQASQSWITFSSSLQGTTLTLTADPGLPSRPVLYRIENWTAPPSAVAVDGATVTVNLEGALPAAASEVAANASPTSTWFYDAKAQRLIVKAVP